MNVAPYSTAADVYLNGQLATASGGIASGSFSLKYGALQPGTYSIKFTKTGTTDSLTAAKILREREGPPNSLDTMKSGSPSDVDHGQSDPAETSVGSAGLERGWFFLPFASSGRPWNDLRLQWRIVWPLLLLGVIALGAGAIVAGASELSQLVIALSR